MENIMAFMKEREEELLRIQKEKEKSLKKAPEGTLRICRNGKKPQFYHRIDANDFNGKYIKEKDKRLVMRLAQKDYDKKVLQSVKKELDAIQKYIKNYPKTAVENIYSKLSNERRELIIPVWESPEEYIERWNAVEYSKKEFYDTETNFYTDKGERVRSKSELIIASLLQKKGLPYRYEYPIYLDGFGTVFPDFTILDIKNKREIYWEHMGMMDIPEYAEKALKKIQCYEQNGIFPGKNLILSFETKTNPLNSLLVEKLIETYLG